MTSDNIYAPGRKIQYDHTKSGQKKVFCHKKQKVTFIFRKWLYSMTIESYRSEKLFYET